jgi:MFS family permease
VVTPTRQATFREVFGVREFRPLFGTFLLSTAGDELARVALTVLVYERTSSPLLSSLTFAIGHLPWLLGGPLLSAVADRLPRHRVLIAADAVRAGLLALMAVPGTPLPVLLGLLFLVSLCAPPFESARSALMADVLEGDRYAVATSLTNISLQLAQVVGFLAAGALVAVLNPSAALLIDGITFAISALWLARGLQRRPAPTAAAGEVPQSLWQDIGDGLRLIAASPRLLAIMGVLWVATMFTTASEGVAAPLVEELGSRATAIGVLLAAHPLGVTVGGLVVARLVPPARREGLVVPLVVLSLAPVLAAGLVAVLKSPSELTFALVVALIFLYGIGASWLIPLNVAFVQAVGAFLAGLGAEGFSAGSVVAVSGALGLVLVTPVLVAFRRTRGHVAEGATTEGPSGA